MNPIEASQSIQLLLSGVTLLVVVCGGIVTTLLLRGTMQRFQEVLDHIRKMTEDHETRLAVVEDRMDYRFPALRAAHERTD